MAPFVQPQERSYVQLIDFSKKLREDRQKQLDQQKKQELFKRGELDTSDLDESDVFVDILSDRYRQSVAAAKQQEEASKAKNSENAAAPSTERVTKEKLTLRELNQALVNAQQFINGAQYYLAQKLLEECADRIDEQATDDESIVVRMKKSAIDFLLAKSYVLKGELDLALEKFDQCIAQSSSNIEKWSQLSMSNENDNEKLLLIDALYSRAVLHFNCNRTDLSLKDYCQCIDQFRTEMNQDSLLLQNHAAVELYTSALNNRAFLLLDNPSLHSSEVMSGKDAYAIIESDLHESIKLNKQIGHDDRYSMQNFYNLARLYLMVHRFEDAIIYYHKFIDVYGDKSSPHLTAHSALADCFMALGQFSKAIPHISICIDSLLKATQELTQKDRSYKPARKELAKAYMKRAECNLGLLDEPVSVLDDISKSVEYDRAGATFWVHRALFHMFHRGDYDKAIFDFSVALLRYQGSSSGAVPQSTSTDTSVELQHHDVLLLRSMCHERMSQWEDAIADYNQLIEQLQPTVSLDDTIPETRLSRVLSLLMNTYQSPIQLFLTSDVSNLESVDNITSAKFLLSRVHTRVAMLYLELGKQMIITKQEFDYSKYMEYALKHLRQALALDASNYSAIFHRSQLAIQLYKKRDQLNVTLPNENKKPNEYYNLVIGDLSKLLDSPSEDHKRYALYNRAVVNFKRQEYESTINDLTMYLTSADNTNLSAEEKERVIDLRRSAYLKQQKYWTWIQDHLST